jgi:hypothetical protein
MNKNQGVIAGVFGCGFAVLGIFTLGIVFVPIAALCSLIGLVRGASGPSVTGIGISLLGGVLTVAGFVTSPALMLATGGALVASHVASAPVQQPVVQQQQQMPRAPVSTADAVQAANKEAERAIIECRAKRLSGELKTFVASAQCAGPRIMQAYSAANYRYMDLIALFVAKRLRVAEKLDRDEMSEIQAQLENTKDFSQIVEAQQRRDKLGK